MLPSTAPRTETSAFWRPWLPRLAPLAERVRRYLADVRKRLAWPRPPAPVFHITHYKAGSQWIRRILEALAGPWAVTPQADGSQFFSDPIHPHCVYPTLYMTRDDFQRVRRPADSRHFVVIRDLRDTLVSAYFSLKISHDSPDARMEKFRSMLQSINVEEGLIHMTHGFCRRVAAIQTSWLGETDTLIKYEDLLANDESILAPVLLDHCRLPGGRDFLRLIVTSNRFEALTGGRKPGVEDVHSHERKGVSGDWRNHFTDNVAKVFKDRYGQLLIATGYEIDDRW